MGTAACALIVDPGLLTVEDEKGLIVKLPVAPPP